MVQINLETSFKRGLKVEINKNCESSTFFNDIKSLNYDKIAIFDEPTPIESKYSVKIIAKSEYPNALTAQEQLKQTIRMSFESIKLKMPLLTSSKIQQIAAFCKKEGIDVNPTEIKSNQLVKFNSPCHKLPILEQTIQDLQCDYPWDNGQIDFQIISLTQTNEQKDYNFIVREFKNTMFGNEIISINRIQNNDLYTNFQNSVRICLQFKEKNGILFDEGDDGFLNLWHGTGNKDPYELIERKTAALSTQYARDQGMWGRGIYFAKDAAYSNNFSFKKEKGLRGVVKYLLFCKVFIGKSIQTQPDSNIREPPYLDKIKKVFYDSIHGVTGNSLVYVIYENDRCYPFYLVEYR